ncbi:TIGR00180 family glycosyltransferase [Sediminibacterium sp.]|uniref:TIGR00180 family glycosyltransferase n=1 Tax=Sediminibacterium sp. TaxID=1917865 RepID=UPI00273205E6|nr:TIGR00180 family glycosyltransferase [Sediminibacterium sp.]MDP2420244.1 TIGR00180 family glycosyltransferase [Sediminibacterium sp.]
MINLTLIVPTHNRHTYLRRSMEYFKNLNACIIYCDSTEQEFIGELSSNIKYLHLKGLNFSDKILVALDLANTDYVALCADDDFIVIESLYKGVSFLSSNQDFKVVVGKYVSFNPIFDNCYYPLYQELPSDINMGLEKNIDKFFSNYYQILWALYDKVLLTESFKIIKEGKFYNDNYIELVIGACSCKRGGIKFINDIWGVRESNSSEHWGDKHFPILNMKIANNHNDFKKFKELVDKVVFEGYAEKIILAYFKNQNPKIYLFKLYVNKFLGKNLKERIKKIFFTDRKKISLSSNDLEKLSKISYVLKKA